MELGLTGIEVFGIDELFEKEVVEGEEREREEKEEEERELGRGLGTFFSRLWYFNRIRRREDKKKTYLINRPISLMSVISLTLSTPPKTDKYHHKN